MRSPKREGRTILAYITLAISAAKGRADDHITSLTRVTTACDSPGDSIPSNDEEAADSMNETPPRKKKENLFSKIGKKVRRLFKPLRMKSDQNSKDIEKSCGGDDDSDDDSDYDDLAAFQDVVDMLDFSNLGQVALKCRHIIQTTSSGDLNAVTANLGLSCTIDHEPMYGSYNLVYAINFSDGIKWIARIPGHGKRFGTDDCEKMESEYQTMRYIQKHTSIPLPEVCFWSTSCSLVGVPFALMSFVEGRGLDTAWTPDGLTETQRFQILDEIAKFMAQLHTLQFDKMGALSFDQQAAVQEVGKSVALRPDFDSAWAETVSFGPFDSYKQSRIEILGEGSEMHIRQQGCYPVLRMIIDSIPSYLLGPNRFALSPFDLNSQNILIDEHGHITAFIDWDQTWTKPTSAGCGRYPSWITRDWDPAMYGYRPHQPEHHCDHEEPPWTLRMYRRRYAEAFAKSAAGYDDYDPRMTSQSHLLEALNIAISNTLSRGPILRTFLEHAFDGNPPFILGEYVNDFEEGDTAEKDAILREAFGKMWHAEWEEL